MRKYWLLSMIFTILLLMPLLSCGGGGGGGDGDAGPAQEGSSCDNAIAITSGQSVSDVVQGQDSIHYEINLTGNQALYIEVTENDSEVGVSITTSLSGQYIELSDGGFYFEDAVSVCLVAEAVKSANTVDLPFTFTATEIAMSIGSTPELAIEAVEGTPITGTLDEGEIIYYKLAASSGENIEFSSDGTGNYCLVVPTVYSDQSLGSENLIDPLTADATEQSLLYTFDVESSGTYYIAVEPDLACSGTISFSFTLQTVTASATFISGTTQYSIAPAISPGIVYYDILSGSDATWYKITGTSGRTVDLNVAYNYSEGIDIELYADPASIPVREATADNTGEADVSYNMSFSEAVHSYYIKLVYNTQGLQRRVEFSIDTSVTPAGRSPAVAIGFNTNCPGCLPANYSNPMTEYIWWKADGVTAGKNFTMSAYNKTDGGDVQVTVFDSLDEAVLYFDFPENATYANRAIMQFEAGPNSLELTTRRADLTRDYYILIEAPNIDDYEVLADVLIDGGSSTPTTAPVLQTSHVYLTSYSASSPKWYKFENVGTEAHVRILHEDTGMSIRVARMYDLVLGDPEPQEIVELEPVPGTYNEYSWDWEDYSAYPELWVQFKYSGTQAITSAFVVYIEYP
jgi:hypothetical protein